MQIDHPTIGDVLARPKCLSICTPLSRCTDRIVEKSTSASVNLPLVFLSLCFTFVLFYSCISSSATPQTSVQELTKAGNSCYHSSRYADAKRFYNAALSLADPNSLAAANLLINLGAAYKEQQDYRQAQSCFERSLGIKTRLLGTTAQSTVNTRRFLEALRKDAQQKGISLIQHRNHHSYGSAPSIQRDIRETQSHPPSEIEFKQFTIVNMCRLSDNDKDMMLHPTTYERPIYKTVYCGTDIDGRPQYRRVLDHMEDVKVGHGELQVDREVKDLCDRYEVRTMSAESLLRRLVRGDVLFELDSVLLLIACDDAEVRDWHVGTQVELSRLGSSLHVRLRDELSRKVIAAEVIGAH
jgi:hypothetical protein